MKKLKCKFETEELYMYQGYGQTKEACKSLGLIFEEREDRGFMEITIYDPEVPLERVQFCQVRDAFLVSEVFWEVMDRKDVELLFEEEEL